MGIFPESSERVTYEQLLQLDDDQLFAFFDLVVLDPAALREQIRAMSDQEIIDEYGLDEDESPDDVRAELLGLSDYRLLREHDSDDPATLREELVGWQCMHCPMWLDNEYYMLHDEVWLAANPGCSGMMCIGCVEDRIGRRLTPADFIDAPINTDSCAGQATMRLNDRRGHDVTRSVDYKTGTSVD